MAEWISVRDRMPESVQIEGGNVFSHVLCFYREHEKTVHMGYVRKDTAHFLDGDEYVYRWYDQNGTRWEDVTHWMPLPEPPEEVKK